jgi:hypothetical protein
VSCTPRLSGSQTSFVSESCFRRLRLPRTNTNLVINTVGDCSSPTVNGSVELTIRTGAHLPDMRTSAVIMMNVTRRLPTQPIDTAGWTPLNHRRLADPTFDMPGVIDIILGADVYDTIVLGGRAKIADDVFLKNTLFGWILSGVGKTTNPTGRTQSTHITTEERYIRGIWMPTKSLSRWSNCSVSPPSSTPQGHTPPGPNPCLPLDQRYEIAFRSAGIRINENTPPGTTPPDPTPLDTSRLSRIPVLMSSLRASRPTIKPRLLPTYAEVVFTPQDE